MRFGEKGFRTGRQPASALLLCLAAQLSLFATQPAFAVEPRSKEQLALKEAVEIARESNPDLAIVAEELKVASGVLQQAKYLSPFNFTSDNAFAYRTREGQSNSQDWRVAMVQEFEIFGQRGLREKSASLNYEVRRADLANQVRLLTATVKLTFFDAMSAGRYADALGRLEKLDARLLDAARTRFSAGEIGQIDFNLAAVRHGQTHRALLESREQYRLHRSSLGRLLGGVAGPAPVPIGDLATPGIVHPLDSLLIMAKHNRPDLRAHQLEIARSETDQALNHRLNLPNLMLGVAVGHEQNTERFGGPLLGFSIPILNHRTGEATILTARAAQARARRRATELNVEHEVRDAFDRYQTALVVLSSLEAEVVGPARESFDLLERAFTEGKIDLLRLAVAERESFEAQRAHVEAWFAVVSAQVALEMAIGATL